MRISDWSSDVCFSDLSLYGLAKVAVLPSLATLSDLKRVELGQMKGISSIGPVLEAPELRELSLLKIVPVAREDIPLLQRHPTLERFDWSLDRKSTRLNSSH